MNTGSETKIMVVQTPFIKRFYIDTPHEAYVECVMCENGVPFTTDMYSVKILPIDDSVSTEEVNSCVKIAPNDELNDQERFLKEREKKQFKRMKRGR